jgi:glutamate carboxypeptidase
MPAAVDPRPYAAALVDALPATLALTERLVAIDSPPDDPDGVDAVTRAVADALAALGFAIERVPLSGRGDRLSATLALGRGPRLLILGHADTVWPAGTAAAWPFARDGDRVTGPGVGDMKGGVAMAIAALGVLRASGGLDGLGAVRFLLVPDEELGSVGSRGWIEAAARDADACLCLEAAAPGGGIVTARGAVGAMTVRATGRAVHWTDPEAGASAVSALAPLVERLEGLSRREAGVLASVGVLRGGTARQVVPGAAELHLDVRAPDAASAGALVAKVGAVVARAAAPEGVALHVEGGVTRPAFPASGGTRWLYGQAQALCDRLGAPLHAVRERGGSDASFAAALGVPTLDGLGPICHDNCGRGEWVEVPSIVERGALLAGLIATLAREGRAIDKAGAPATAAA